MNRKHKNDPDFVARKRGRPIAQQDFFNLQPNSESDEANEEA